MMVRFLVSNLDLAKHGHAVDEYLLNLLSSPKYEFSSSQKLLNKTVPNTSTSQLTILL